MRPDNSMPQNTKSIPPRWPAGPVGVVIAAFLSGLVVAHVPAARVGPLLWIYNLGITIFRSERALQIVMDLAVAAHVVEALILARMCIKAKLPASQTCGWCGMALFIGYGAIHSFKQSLKRQ